MSIETIKSEPVKKTNKPYSWMYGSKEFSDIDLKFKDGSILPAHKLILSTWSDFFKVIFVKDPEKHGAVFSETNRDSIDISEENCATVKVFIGILYELPEESRLININNLFDIFKMSQFYQSTRVTELCLQKFEKYLDKLNIYPRKPFCLRIIEEMRLYDARNNPTNERIHNVLVLAVSKLVSIIDSNTNAGSMWVWMFDVDYDSLLFVMNMLGDKKQVQQKLDSNDSLFHFVMAWGIMHFMMLQDSDPFKLTKIMEILRKLASEGSRIYGLIQAYSHAKEIKIENELGTLNAEMYTKPLKEFFFAVYEMLNFVLLDRMIHSFQTNMDAHSDTFNISMWNKWETWNQKIAEKRKESSTPKKESRHKRVKTMEQGNLPDSPNSMSDVGEEIE